MKFFSVVVNVILLCGVVVFATPASPPNFFKGSVLRNELFDENDLLNRMQASIRAADISPIIDQFECIIGALATVSENNGLALFWSKSKSQFESSITNWRQCSSEQGSLYYLCNLKQGFITSKLIVQYASLAAEQNPYFFLLLVQELQQSCVSGVDNFLETNANRALDFEYFKCVLDAISDAVGESEAEEIWTKYQDVLQAIYEQLLNCKNQEKPLQQVKCYVEGVSGFISNLIKFYDELVQVNVELIQKIEQYVQQRCYP